MWWCPKNNKYKVCFKECTFAHKMVGFKTFRALGKCRKTGIYGACIRPQGTLQNLSHKNFSMILSCKMTEFSWGLRKSFYEDFLRRGEFVQNAISWKGTKMNLLQNILLIARNFKRISVTKWHKIYGADQDQSFWSSKNNWKMACAKESFHKAAVHREPFYVQANVQKIPSNEKERFFCKLS